MTYPLALTDWRVIGWAALPQIIDFCDLAPRTKLIIHIIYAHAFGTKSRVVLGEAMLAREAHCSRRTIITHMNIAEMVGFITRKRNGQRKRNLITLNLKEGAARLHDAIELNIGCLNPIIFTGVKRPMAFWLARWKRYKAARPGILAWR